MKLSRLMGIVAMVLLSTQHLLAQQPKPKRIVFLIGDGMGLAQISGAMYGYTGQNAFARFTVIGLSNTSSSDHYITDSGAGATAFSIGKKTFNRAIGVAHDSTPYPTLFELAKKKGYSTGLAVTSSIVHATPASFYAHVINRKMYDSIAMFLLNGSVDIAIGGGTDFVTNRKDGRNLAAMLKQSGFEVISDSVLVNIAAKRYIYLLAPDELPKMEKGRGDLLKQASLQAAKNLSSNKNGYLLMIEGSQIDWGGHENSFSYMAAELRDFNEVINAFLDMAEKDKEMLVIVTADHETGGLTLNEGGTSQTFRPKFSTGDHTGIMVPVFAFGAGAELFGGMYENTEIFTKIVQLLQLK